MKILVITPFNIFPPYWGGGQRTYHLIKSLAQQHKVYLIFPSYPQFQDANPKMYQEEMKKLGVEIRPIDNWFKWQIIEFLNPFLFLKSLYLLFSKRIEFIICDYPWSGVYTLLLHFLTRKPYIFFEHNIEYKIKEQTKSKYTNLMKLLEILLCKFAKLIVVVSKKNKQELIKLGVNKKKILILENGFDSHRFFPNDKFRKIIRKKLKIKDNEVLVFFCGKLDYAPNIEALYSIRWKILPKVVKRVNAKFVIVGGGKNRLDPNLRHPNMIFTGVVNEIERYLNAADVVIVPITKGSGTRIKVLEAIACGKVVIATKKGVESLVNKLTKPFLRITDNWEIFSKYIKEASKGFKNRTPPQEFIQKYSWGEIYKKLLKWIERYERHR